MTLFDTQRWSVQISRFCLSYSCRFNLTTKCDFHSFNGTGIISLTIRAKSSTLNVNPLRSTTHTRTPFWKIFLDNFRFRCIATNFGKTLASHHHICHGEERVEPAKINWKKKLINHNIFVLVYNYWAEEIFLKSRPKKKQKNKTKKLVKSRDQSGKNDSLFYFTSF